MLNARRGINLARRFSTEIPIKQVATIFRMNVKNEANALQMDELIEKSAKPVVSQSKGYVKNIRSVCKGEWEYETYFVWDSLDNYKVWKESPERAKLVEESLMPKLEELGIKESFYAGVRVFDEK
jgi:antibiotic biosynthesis monooxygenase (ABM) superfamily enzyme